MKLRHKFLNCTFVSSLLVAAAQAADYTWTNTTANGSLGSTSGYTLDSASNWNTTPVFNETSTLLFPSSLGSITINGPSYWVSVPTINKMVFSSGTAWRFNNGSTTLNFAGTTPTLDVQNGSVRMEVAIQSSAGITKTGSGVVYSNLQSVSAGFTGPLTIAAGTWQAFNNFALGDSKTVNIQSGATLNMSSLALGANGITGQSGVSRAYTLNIAGNGWGDGAIIGSASTLNGFSGIKNLTLTADASIGGTGTYDIAYNGGTISGGGNTLTKTGSGTIWMRGSASSIAYQVDQGILVASDHNNALGGAGGAASVASGATLASSSSRSFATPLTLDSGSTLQNLSGTTTWSGAVALGAGDGVTVTGNFNANTTISSVISGASGTLIKSGPNILTLSNANTYTGLTKITQGTLALGAAGSIADSSEIQVSNGANLNVLSVTGGYTLGNTQTLSGGGTVSGNTTIEGTHSPGFSPGIQTFTTNLTYAEGSTLVWELIDNSFAAADRGVTYDGINVQGDLSFAGATTLDLTFNLASSLVDWTDELWGGFAEWKIFDVDGSVTGLENVSLPLASTMFDSNGVDLLSTRPTSYFYVSEKSDGVYLFYAVPEPSSLVLGGLGALALLRRRRTA